jgi:predicted dehydrogenase
MKKIIEGQTKNNPQSRRDFIKHSGTIVAGATLGAALPLQTMASFHHGVDETLKVALIGCGARGAGAAVNALRTEGSVELVAMADAFRDKLDETYDNLMQIEGVKEKVKVSEEHKFVGFDGYKEAIKLADVVLLVTPPAFRPLHFEAAVDAGKHVFMEKPLASDSPGIRKVLEVGKIADQKGLKVLVGLQNRYAPEFQEVAKRVKDGEIGEIISASDYYMIGPVKLVPRQPEWTEMEFQMRNWRHFNWLWAGSPAGLQIHNTDLVNWVMDAYPVKASGLGGKSGQRGPEYGDIFDNFFIEYEYENNVKLNSQIRHIGGTWNKGGAYIIGTKGIADFKNASTTDHKGNVIWRNRQKYGNPYQLQTDHLFECIRNGTPLNDTEWGAKSTMTTIMGRMASHSGQLLSWDESLASELHLLPEKFEWNEMPRFVAGEDGCYPVPIPGISPPL